MATKTGELRETLIEAIAAVKEKKMSAADAGAIAKLAAQINLSLKVEIEALESEAMQAGAPGSFSLGDEKPKS